LQLLVLLADVIDALHHRSRTIRVATETLDYLGTLTDYSAAAAAAPAAAAAAAAATGQL
jgi:hypothetical protein